MASKTETLIERKLDTMILLAQHQLALDLFKAGVSKEDIGKHLHVAKAKVVAMLKVVTIQE